MTITMEDLRAAFKAGRDSRKGTCCPVCDRFAKTYKVKLDVPMATALAWMVKNHGTGWVDIIRNAPPWLRQSRRLTKLKYWGFVVQRDAPPPGKKTSGVWRATLTGEAWIKGMLPAPPWLLIYADKTEGGPAHSIKPHDVLGRFDYQAMMQEAAT